MRGVVLRFLFPLLTLLYLAVVLLHLTSTGQAAAPPAQIATPVAQAGTSAARFTVTDLGVIPAPGDGPGATALNDQGQVVGGFDHAFLWSHGRSEDLGTFPPQSDAAPDSVALAVNNRGQIVGTSRDYAPHFDPNVQEAGGVIFQKNGPRQLVPDNLSFVPEAINDRGEVAGVKTRRAFLYANGKLILLGLLGRASADNHSDAQGINRQGQVVGWSTLPGPGDHELPVHAFLWQMKGRSGRMRDLGTLPGWTDSYACAINDRGEVIGTVSSGPDAAEGVPAGYPRLAFLWRAGKIGDLGTLPGGHSSEAMDINHGGAVVGESGGRAFLWESGHMRDLNALIPADSGWALAEARAINAGGQIAGNGQFNGEHHAFLLTPRRLTSRAPARS